MINNSPYSASLTGCSFMLYELNRILPLMLDDNAEELLKLEIEQNNLLMVDNLNSRKRYIAELKRRFASVPRSFWHAFQTLNEDAQRLALFYVMMKCYRLVFDFHINVTIKKWYSIDHRIENDNIAMELSEIAANDEFVDAWSDLTKKRCVSAYLTFLNQAGLYDRKTGLLMKANLTDEDYSFFIKIGEDWFLEACFLQPYEIERIQQLTE